MSRALETQFVRIVENAFGRGKTRYFKKNLLSWSNDLVVVLFVVNCTVFLSVCLIW